MTVRLGHYTLVGLAAEYRLTDRWSSSAREAKPMRVMMTADGLTRFHEMAVTVTDEAID